MVLLSVRAGLRAKEIAAITWGMVTGAQGKVGTALHLTNAAKGCFCGLGRTFKVATLLSASNDPTIL